MTALELFQLYNPRLSKLGAWPPKDADGESVFDWHEPDDCFNWSGSECEPFDTRWVPDHAAACILRCAAEDVLREEILILFEPDLNDPDTGHFVEVFGYLPESNRHVASGPTIHHALCAALDAVIQEQGK